MMRSVIRSSLKSRILVLALALVVLVVGFIQVRDMPRDVLPEFSRPTVQVQTEALGLSAQDVEQLITVPIEQDLLNGVAFLDKIHSRSVPGLSSIDLVFERGTDLAKARQVVNERLTQAHALPNVSQPPQMLQPLSSTSRVMMVGLTSDKLSLIDLGVLARWTIRPRLMGVPGVANVAVWGQRERQLQVQVDPEQLAAKNVSLDEVITTTGNSLWWSPLGRLEANTPGTGGFVDAPQQRLGVFHESPIKTPQDLSQVIVESTEGATPVPVSTTVPATAAARRAAAAQAAVDEAAGTTPARPPLKLGEVAQVVEDHQPLIGDAVFTNGPGLLLVVEKFPEANVVDVTRGVEDALRALQPGLAGVKVDAPVFRPATYIESSTDNLFIALLVGIALLALMLLVLFLAWRTAVVAAVTIVLSLVAAVFVLHLRGTTLNAMVLAGLVLALVVVLDDVVNDTQSVGRRILERRRAGDDPATAIVAAEGSMAVRRPLAYATVIVLLSLLPITVLKGEAGAFLPQLALAFAVVVAVSMAVALTVTPALCLLLFARGPMDDRQPPLARWMTRSYDRVSGRLTTAPRFAIAVAAVIALVGLAVVPFLDRGRSLVPTFRDRDLLVSWNAAPGTSLAEMDRVTARASKELKALPGVSDVGAHLGRAVMADQVVGVNSSQLWVKVKQSADYDSTVAKVTQVVKGYPGFAHHVLTYPNERVEQVLSTGGANRDITVRIYGQDLATLRSKADEVRQALSKIKGVSDLNVEAQDVEPAFQVKVNLAAAERAGIKPGDVRRSAATLLSGLGVGALFEEQKVFDVVVWGTPQTRANLSNIRNLLIDTPNRGHVKLGEVADVQVASTPNVIRHEDVSRSIDIGANASDGDTGSVAAKIKDTLKGISFPVEYHAEVLGDYANRATDQRTFVALCIVAAIGVFLLLQAAFASWRLALIGFLMLPLAVTGGLLLLLADGGSFTIGSLAGFVAVVAIAARMVVAFASRAQDLESTDRFGSRAKCVVAASGERLLPTVMTALGALALYAPFLVIGDLPGNEIARPLVVVVLGGVAVSALVSLFVVPALYLRFGPKDGRELARARAVDELIAEESAWSTAGVGAIDGNGRRTIPTPATET